MQEYKVTSKRQTRLPRDVRAHLIHTAGVIANAVGTNGAGDIFVGAFLYTINSGHNFVWAAKFATAASARVVSQFGPRIKAVEYGQIKQQFGI